MPQIKKLITIYENGVQKNLKDINSILENTKINNPIITGSYDKILSISAKKFTEKWISGRKYTRTLFLKKAFSDFYPEKYIEASLYIDAMINILDDLFDEEMDKKEKTCYIVEFLRTFSLYHQQQSQKNFKIDISYYFNELISLAIAEKYYKEFIKKEKNTNKIIEYSIKSHDIRSLDIDIFTQIALINYKISSQKTKKIIEIARIFRAINIIKKDIEDIEYDTKNNMESVISIVANQKNCDFTKYISALLDYYSAQAQKIKLPNKSTDKKFSMPINNFYSMIEKNKIEILKKIKSL